jgi:mannosyl-oligosaccharide alpha-1,2-mannosidase
MVLKRRRLLLVSLAVLGVIAYFTLPRESNDGRPRQLSPWMRALRGDSSAFQIHLDGALLDWIPSGRPEIYPVPSYYELPSKDEYQSLPRIQHDFDDQTGLADRERQQEVKAAFLRSWNSYKAFAWLEDELKPVSAQGKATFSAWGATLVDSLDTLWIMGLKDEFAEAVEAATFIDFSTPDNLPISVFETTIRYLGGFLGAYDISDGQYPSLLRKAEEVGDMLYRAFDTNNRMPVTMWRKAYGEEAPRETTIAELGSLTLEFTRLSQLTGNMKYYDAIHRITTCLGSQQMLTKVPGLFPHKVDPKRCDFSHDSSFSLGAFADSAYEYLPKMAQLLNNSIADYRSMYLNALDPIKQHLLSRPMTPTNEDILFPQTYRAYKDNAAALPQMQHLSCFAGGMFAQGSRLFSRPADLETARRITNGCIWAYNATATGIMPEHFFFLPCVSSSSSSASAAPCIWNETAWRAALWDDSHHDPLFQQRNHRKMRLDDRIDHAVNHTDCPRGMTSLSNREYRLRPEAIEAVFVLYRVTGEEWWREAAWRMFLAVEAQTKTEWAYSSIDDVTLRAPREVGQGGGDDAEGTRRWHRKLDKMETFWTAETLKYFYLIFAEPELVSLDRFVLNTEAHPLRLGD